MSVDFLRNECVNAHFLQKVNFSLHLQGLRTLELCVDNLQPDFLYDHIQPVRAELMQALWRTLRNPVDNIAHVAFRVLGKFGGGNRKMLREPQMVSKCTLANNLLVSVQHYILR